MKATMSVTFTHVPGFPGGTGGKEPTCQEMQV